MKKEKILFANIGWMTHYKGNTKKDQIVGGGSWSNDDKHEAFNFSPIKGKCYGYVQPVRWGTISLNRIGDDYKPDRINGVIVVWIATHPKAKGTFIIGWYKNATVFSKFQESNMASRNNYDYNIVAKEEDCTLLPLDQRTFLIPRAKDANKGFLGQSNVWYADSSEEKVRKFRKDVLDYIQNFTTSSKHISKQSIAVDAEVRKIVEKTAVNYVTKHYKEIGYTVTSREKENVGWDLDAEIGSTCLKLEVKGLAGNKVSVRISQNEYKSMINNKNCYRLCVVTKVLKSPTLIIFAWDDEQGAWASDIDPSIKISIEEKPSYLAVVE